VNWGFNLLNEPILTTLHQKDGTTIIFTPVEMNTTTPTGKKERRFRMQLISDNPNNPYYNNVSVPKVLERVEDTGYHSSTPKVDVALESGDVEEVNVAKAIDSIKSSVSKQTFKDVDVVVNLIDKFSEAREFAKRTNVASVLNRYDFNQLIFNRIYS